MLRLILLSSLLLLAFNAQAREVTVGVYDNDPKVFRDDDGRPSGIFVDLIREIAEREGWNLSFEDCRWSNCLDLTAAGEIDLMPDVAISEERQARFDFHRPPVLHSWSRV